VLFKSGTACPVGGGHGPLSNGGHESQHDGLTRGTNEDVLLGDLDLTGAQLPFELVGWVKRKDGSQSQPATVLQRCPSSRVRAYAADHAVHNVRGKRPIDLGIGYEDLWSDADTLIELWHGGNVALFNCV